MRKGPLIVCAAAVFLLVSFAILYGEPLISGRGDAIVPDAAASSSGPLSIADEQEAYALFGHLTNTAVTGLSLKTSESTYDFRCTDTLRVSVNGQKADYDVFSTLLEQILTMPVITVSPFTPSSSAAVTLTLCAGSAQYTVVFFRDEDEESPYVNLISGDADDPCYQKTDRWRLGTMLLACEGTRIQDEKGEETPFVD